MSAPQVSIIIPLYNQAGFTKLCLEYVERNTPAEIQETILVDNASTDGTASLLESLPSRVKRIRNPTNLGFAKACNQGAEAASGRYLIFLNNDTAPHPGWAEALLEPLGRFPDVGIVGPKLLYPDGTIQQAGVVFSNSKFPYHLYAGCPGNLPGANKERFFQAVTAACFLVSRSDYFAVGGLDERYVNGMEDMHFCLATLQRGKKILYNPASRVTHFESRSENRHAAMAENIRLFMEYWAGRIVQDDYRYFLEDGMDFWAMGNTFLFFGKEKGDALAKERLEKADALARLGDLDSAAQAIGELLVQNPYNTVTLLGIAGFMDRMGKSESAMIMKNLARTYSGG